MLAEDQFHGPLELMLKPLPVQHFPDLPDWMILWNKQRDQECVEFDAWHEILL